MNLFVNLELPTYGQQWLQQQRQCQKLQQSCHQQQQEQHRRHRFCREPERLFLLRQHLQLQQDSEEETDSD